MNLFIHYFDFYIAECLCECRPALKISSFTPKHHQIILYSPYCSLNIFQGIDKENLCNNQELLKLVIISFILLIIKFDPGMMWQGRNQMLYIVTHRVKGFNEDVHVHVNVGHFADGCFASISSQFLNVQKSVRKCCHVAVPRMLLNIR